MKSAPISKKSAIGFYRITSVAVFYSLLSGCFLSLTWNHGHFPIDDGMILAYSWRTLHGQVPYRDFLYPWPPLSILIHQVWFLFPRDLTILAARFGYYFQLTLAAALWIWWGVGAGRVRLNITTLALMAFFYTFSVHYFPVMPWYTVDGILLGTIGGILALKSFKAGTARRFLLLRGLAGMAFVLAAFCKQNFFGLAVLYFAFLGLDYVVGRKVDPSRRGSLLLLALSSVLALVPAILIFGWLFLSQAFSAFVQNATLFATSGALVNYGVLPYLKWRHLIFLPFGIVLGCLAPPGRRSRFIVPFFILGALAILVWQGFHTKDLWGQGNQIFWMSAGLALVNLYRAVVDKRTENLEWAWFGVFALAVAWTSSVSYGWITPLLGIAGVVPLYSEILDRAKLSSVVGRGVALALVVIAIWSIVLVRQLISTKYHCERPRREQTRDLGEVYPRFTSLYTNENLYERYKDLRDLSAKVSAMGHRDIVVFPEFALFYFLEDRVNRALLDSWSPQHYQGYSQRVIDDFSKKKPVVLIELDSPLDAFFYSQGRVIPDWVQSNGTPIAGSKYFNAFIIR